MEVTNSGGCSMSSFKVNIFSTGIENAAVSANGFRIFSMTSKLFELSSPSMGTITIFDIQGKRVSSFEKRNEKINLDLSNSSAGIYLIVLSNGNSKFSKKISVY